MPNTGSLSFMVKKYGHGSVQPYKVKSLQHVCGTINETFRRTFLYSLNMNN